MKQRKMRSINALVGALAEAESKLYNEDSTDLKGLCTLLKDFLKRDDTPERVRLRREFEAGLPLTGEDGLRRKLGAIDMEFFGRAYFPHYFSRPSPEFHRELDAIWQQGVLKGRYPLTPADTKAISRLPGVRRAVAAPRGHAKSTNLTFKGTMHSTLYGYKHYPIIISDSSEQAEGFLDNIRVEFEENTAILEDFGPLAGSVWRSNVLVTKTNIKIEAIGSGKKIRGRKHRNWRPDLIILDDVENDENVRTPEQRSKLKNWFDKAVSKSGDDYTDIVYIGTLLHYDSLLAKTLTNPAYRSIKYKAVIQFSQADDLWQQWESIFTDLSNDDREADALAFFQAHKAAMLEGTQVLWKEKLSYYDLMVMRVSEGEASLTPRSRTSRSTRMTACSWRSGLNTTTRRRSTSAIRSLTSSVLSTPRWARPSEATSPPSSPWPSTAAADICMWWMQTLSGGIPTGLSPMCWPRSGGSGPASATATGSWARKQTSSSGF